MDELNDGELRFYKPWSAADERDTSSISIHYGAVGCGQLLVRDDIMRRDFALTNDILAFDAGYHAVMESIEGNRKDAFIVVRGITDFKDGTTKKDWQPYSSLAAASYMKAIVLALPTAI